MIASDTSFMSKYNQTMYIRSPCFHSSIFMTYSGGGGEGGAGGGGDALGGGGEGGGGEGGGGEGGGAGRLGSLHSSSLGFFGFLQSSSFLGNLHLLIAPITIHVQYICNEALTFQPSRCLLDLSQTID